MLRYGDRILSTICVFPKAKPVPPLPVLPSSALWRQWDKEGLQCQEMRLPSKLILNDIEIIIEYLTPQPAVLQNYWPLGIAVVVVVVLLLLLLLLSSWRCSSC